jgi:hypothetical protein
MLSKYSRYLCTTSLVLTTLFTLLSVFNLHSEMPIKAKAAAILLLGLGAFVYYRFIYTGVDEFHKGLMYSLGIHLLVFVVCVVGAKAGSYSSKH